MPRLANLEPDRGVSQSQGEGKQDACRRIFYLKIKRGGAVGPALSGTCGGFNGRARRNVVREFLVKEWPSLVCIQVT